MNLKRTIAKMIEIYFSKKKDNNNTNKSYQSILDLVKINIDVCKL
jgi:hypothetical protein